ncbi:MAG: hypothetical protein HZB17_11645, partial [Chloroflexi bacterium]|nr:hypothetical protein [Chloroflexota bacterium]
ELNEAYATLSNTNRRYFYDIDYRKRKQSSPPPPQPPHEPKPPAPAQTATPPKEKQEERHESEISYANPFKSNEPKNSSPFSLSVRDIVILLVFLFGVGRAAMQMFSPEIANPSPETLYSKAYRDITTMSENERREIAKFLQADPPFLFSPEWRSEYSSHVNLLKQSLEKLEGLTPPPKYRPLHDATVNYYRKHVAVSDCVIAWAQSRNPNDADKCKGIAELVDADYEKLTEELNKIK